MNCFIVSVTDTVLGMLFIVAVMTMAVCVNCIKTASLEIAIQKQNTSLNALIDSGNLLREPISGKPVIIACYTSLRSVIPTELLDLFKHQDLSVAPNEAALTKLRLIPTHSVGKNGLLYALLPESVTINGNQVDAYVAVDTSKNSYGEYQAIVPSVLIE